MQPPVNTVNLKPALEQYSAFALNMPQGLMANTHGY
jgi:hypothetical protein